MQSSPPHHLPCSLQRATPRAPQAVPQEGRQRATSRVWRWRDWTVEYFELVEHRHPGDRNHLSPVVHRPDEPKRKIVDHMLRAWKQWLAQLRVVVVAGQYLGSLPNGLGLGPSRSFVHTNWFRNVPDIHQISPDYNKHGLASKKQGKESWAVKQRFKKVWLPSTTNTTTLIYFSGLSLPGLKTNRPTQTNNLTVHSWIGLPHVRQSNVHHILRYT